MQTFEIKRGHGKTLDNGGLKKLMEEEFGLLPTQIVIILEIVQFQEVPMTIWN